MKKAYGFTLVELLAVIVILAIILAIAVPGISGIIKSSTRASFASDAKLILKAVDYKMLENENFDISSINKSNIKDLFNISDENYSSVEVNSIDDILYVKLTGLGKWDGLIACGVYKNMIVSDVDNCSTNFDLSSIVYSPNGSTSYIKSSTVTVTVTDKNLDSNSLKYVWTEGLTTPTDAEYINSFTNGSQIAMPNDNGLFYLHVMAKDTENNILRKVKEFKLDNVKPVLTMLGNTTVNVVVGDSYDDAGATASDNIDGDITTNIEITSNINLNVPGTYSVIYNVSDEAGNSATEIVRTVRVISPSGPMVGAGSGFIDISKAHEGLTQYTGVGLSPGSGGGQLYVYTQIKNNGSTSYSARHIYEYWTGEITVYSQTNFSVPDGRYIVRGTQYSYDTSSTVYQNTYFDTSNVAKNGDWTFFINHIYVNGAMYHSNGFTFYQYTNQRPTVNVFDLSYDNSNDRFEFDVSVSDPDNTTLSYTYRVQNQGDNGTSYKTDWIISDKIGLIPTDGWTEGTYRVYFEVKDNKEWSRYYKDIMLIRN